jgi:hypothetical protein
LEHVGEGSLIDTEIFETELLSNDTTILIDRPGAVRGSERLDVGDGNPISIEINVPCCKHTCRGCCVTIEIKSLETALDNHEHLITTFLVI